MVVSIYETKNTLSESQNAIIVEVEVLTIDGSSQERVERIYDNLLIWVSKVQFP